LQRLPDPVRIPTNGIELEVFEQGAGAPVVLCHGWPEHAYSWRHQVSPLAEAGYHVIVPNQRGYGHSSRPQEVVDYDIAHLAADLTGLLDHFGYDRAVFCGHDWGAILVWNLAMLHPDRVAGVINLSVPLLRRGPTDWVSHWESLLGEDFYIVHFNRQPGVADAVFEENPRRFLGNLYRTHQWQEPAAEPQSGMPLINLARANRPRGRPLMSDAELDVFVRAFEHSGFSGGINWYRNFARNWELTADVPEHVPHPAMMIYGRYDIVPVFDRLRDFVPMVETHVLDCGHWIQQELPGETNRLMLGWLERNHPSKPRRSSQ
jgi:pimeloyl-ACP methyl ester carboxylesterase